MYQAKTIMMICAVTSVLEQTRRGCEYARLADMNNGILTIHMEAIEERKGRREVAEVWSHIPENIS